MSIKLGGPVALARRDAKVLMTMAFINELVRQIPWNRCVNTAKQPD